MHALRHNPSLNRRNRAAIQLVEISGDAVFVAESQAIIARARDAIHASGRDAPAQHDGLPRLPAGEVQAQHNA